MSTYVDETQAQRLARLATDPGDPDIRDEAARLLAAAQAGLMLGPRQLAWVRKLGQPRTAVCSRVEPDGACGWLRRHGARFNLSVPPVGEPALCPYRAAQSWPACPGYRRATGAS